MSQQKRYSTTVYIGNGKRKYVSASSQRELDRKVFDMKKEVKAGKDLQAVSTFGYWADKWYKEIKEPSGISAGTLQQYRAAISHLLKEFEDLDFKDISFSDFQRFINQFSREKGDITRKVPSRASIQNVVKVYNAIAEYAAINNIPGAKRFKNVAINKNAPVKERRALTEREIEWIVQTPHKCQLPAMIMTFAGLRRGELIPLQWTDIDLDNAIININKSVVFEDGNTPTIKQGGKSAAAVRRVPIPPVLVDFLREYRQNNDINSVFVCTQGNGNLYTATSFRKLWNSYLKELNFIYYYDKEYPEDWDKRKTLPMMIEPFTSHYCRHTFATLLYLQGVPAATAMQYLGHSNIQVTINTYTDLEQYYKFELPESFRQKLETEYKVRTA